MQIKIILDSKRLLHTSTTGYNLPNHASPLVYLDEHWLARLSRWSGVRDVEVLKLARLGHDRTRHQGHGLQGEYIQMYIRLRRLIQKIIFFQFCISFVILNFSLSYSILFN